MNPRPRIYDGRPGWRGWLSRHRPAVTTTVAILVVTSYTGTVVLGLSNWPPTATTGYLLAALAVVELAALAATALWARR